MPETSSRVSPTPLLDHVYSGIPSRIFAAANACKERLMGNCTLPASVPRKQEVPVLPPDVTRETFNKAIEQLKGALGGQNVELNDKPLVDGWYMEHPNTHDAYHIFDQDDLVSSATVYPGSTEEVQTVVKWANEHLIPIYPISMGRNLGYGGAAPRVRGSVVLDLGRRMNKVLKLDAEAATCMVEPGVSYYALYEEVQRRKLPLWIDCPDVGGGSVLGNAVERGVGYTPYGDHFANHCGMEVVLPTGEVIRTGMGALPGKDGADNPTWQSFQHPYGPSPDGIFSQSNFGIVTKLGMWLMPATGHRSYLATFPRDEDIEQIVEVIRPLAQKGILGNVPQLRHVIQELATTGNPRSFFYNGPEKQIPREAIAEAASKLPIGNVAWCFYGTVYGTPEGLHERLEIIKKEFGKVAGMKFMLPEDLPEGHYINSRDNICSGKPEIRELDWLNWVPDAGHVFFAPITPTKGSDARKIYEIVHRLHEKWGFDAMPVFIIAGREMHYIDITCYSLSNPDEKRRVFGMLQEMIHEAAVEGYGEYRTHLLLADQVAQTYGWNNQALMRFNETIKDALDPNGILAPGRSGIWPKRFRGKGYEILPDGKQRSSSAPVAGSKL